MQLMEPLTIREHTLDNRLVMLATHLSYCEDGIVDDRLIKFYETRAKYRPGLIIVGGCYTEHLGMSSPTMIGISEDRHIPGLTKLVEAIHKHNVPVAAQLYHAGRYAHSQVLEEEAVSASPTFSRLTRENARALTLEEIKTTIANYGTSALRAKKAGFDAVEILGSAGYLINQFMAPCTNQRNDEYGGNLENRARFALDVIKSVRKSVGKDFLVMYRISGADFVEDGMTLEDNKMIASWLVDAGVDIIDVTGGWHETRIPQITMDVPRGHYAYLAEGIAEMVDIPVIACNRINSPSIAEHILKRGKAQLVGMSRGFIADPAITEKIRSNRPSEIRTCIACNLGCLDNVFKMEPVTCAINPLAGFESERQIGPQGEGKIGVIGAGPVGLETARVLKLRGFDVTLYEKENTPGGMLKLAARIPGRGEFAAYQIHMWREMKKLGVRLKLGILADVASLKSENYDYVVCATGTIAGAPQIDGVESPHVLSAIDVITNGIQDAGRVGIIGGTTLGCYTALFVSKDADSVHIFADDDKIGRDLGRSSRWIIMKELREKGVTISKDTEITQIMNNYLMTSDAESNLISIDTVIVATKLQPRDRLVEKLKREGILVRSVGSEAKTMDLLGSIHQAFEFANELTL
ncbi:MAG: oxidoreductase [Candidatus Thorarchaeota archaeon]